MSNEKHVGQHFTLIDKTSLGKIEEILKRPIANFYYVDDSMKFMFLIRCIILYIKQWQKLEKTCRKPISKSFFFLLLIIVDYLLVHIQMELKLLLSATWNEKLKKLKSDTLFKNLICSCTFKNKA